MKFSGDFEVIASYTQAVGLPNLEDIINRDFRPIM